MARGTKSQSGGRNVSAVRPGAKQPTRSDKGGTLRLGGDNAKGTKTRPSRAILVQASYKDDTGRKWMTLVPQGREAEAEIGIPYGPPDTRPLGLSNEIDVRLNNQLFSRRLFKMFDVRKRPQEVVAALQAAYKVDTTRIINLYREDNDGRTT